MNLVSPLNNINPQSQNSNVKDTFHIFNYINKPENRFGGLVVQRIHPSTSKVSTNKDMFELFAVQFPHSNEKQIDQITIDDIKIGYIYHSPSLTTITEAEFNNDNINKSITTSQNNRTVFVIGINHYNVTKRKFDGSIYIEPDLRDNFIKILKTIDETLLNDVQTPKFSPAFTDIPTFNITTRNLIGYNANRRRGGYSDDVEDTNLENDDLEIIKLNTPYSVAEINNVPTNYSIIQSTEKHNKHKTLRRLKDHKKPEYW